MTTYTVKTNKHEADKIVRKKKMYIFRDDNDYLRPGNVIHFNVVDNMKAISHEIDRKGYMVTDIERGDPIRDGVILIAFSELA